MPPNLHLLGRFELATVSGQAVTISGARAQLLLARLALAGGGQLDRASLSAMLWGERADAQARASLRQLIWTIRQALKPFPDALIAEGELIRLDPVAIASDAALFDRLARSTDKADLEAALALYRGDLLDGIDLISLAPDGYFLDERNRLRDLAQKVAGALAQAHGRDGNWQDVMRVSRRGLIIDPFDEALHFHLIGALQKSGRHREARDQDEAFRSRLKAELGVVTAPQVARPPLQIAAPFSIPVAQPEPGLSPAAIPALARPGRGLRQALGGVVAVAVLFAVGMGLWRMTPGNSAVQPASDTQPSAASKRIPTRNLAAYDHYLRAEAERLAAVGNDQLRAVLATYRSAFSLDPDFAEAHAGYALVAVSLWQRSLDSPLPSIGARAEAYDAAGRALQLDPGNARAMIVLSVIQAQDGARASALATARRAVVAQPDSAEARANLALMLAYGGNTTEARAALTQLQRLDPVPRPEWYLIFGQVAFADGRYDAAIADFVAVWPTLPQNALLLEHLAAAMALQGRLRQANQMKDRLLAVMPNANLHLIERRYALLRDHKQNDRLLEGLRRAGLSEWPYGFTTSETLRLTDADLSAIAADARWTGQLGNGSPFRMESDAKGGFIFHSDLAEVTGTQFVRDGALCQITHLHPPSGEICGPVYRSAAGQTPESQFIFLSANDIRYFSVDD